MKQAIGENEVSETHDHDNCPLCGGCEEVEIVGQDQKTDSYGCPLCMSSDFKEQKAQSTATIATQAAQIEALSLVKQKAERLLAEVFAFNGCKTEGSDLLFGRECEELREAITALSNTGKK